MTRKPRGFPYLMAVVGMLMPLAFAPFNYYPLAVIMPGVLFFVARNEGPKEGFFLGWWFGLGMFGLGVSWVYTSIHDFGQVVAPVAVLITLGFAALLACFTGAAISLACAIKLPCEHRILWMFPSSWVFFEWVRSWILGGFPWLSLGYSQSESVLFTLAPAGGVFAISFFVVSLSAIAVTVWLKPKSLLAGAGGLLVCLIAVNAIVASQQWTETNDDAQSVAILQGNFSQEIKWNRDHLKEQLDWYRKASVDNLDADLVVWPETAIPVYRHRIESQYFAPLGELAASHNTSIVAGVPLLEPEDDLYFNAMIGLGMAEGEYRKYHLVPLGEYFPFRRLLSFIPGLTIPLSDLTSGNRDDALLTIGDYQANISICYEDAFGGLARRGLRESAYLLNASNDAWFGARAPWQHLQIARMRAAETGRDMIRATNTGVSAIIDYKGQIREISNQFEKNVLRGDVFPRTGMTAYGRWGDWPIAAIVVLIFGFFTFKRRYFKH